MSTKSHLYFSLTFTGMVDAVGNRDTDEPAMRASDLKSNLEDLISRALSEGLVTGDSAGVLEDHEVVAGVTAQFPWYHDIGLSAVQLDDKYNLEGDGEHPNFPRSLWRGEVVNENTLLGYWEWVVHQIDSHGPEDA